MKLTELVISFFLWLPALQVVTARGFFPFENARKEAKSGQSENYKDKSPARRLPKYLMKLFLRRSKTLTGKVNTIRGVFPTKIVRSKRALKLVFKQDYLKNKEMWHKDELRVFMKRPKGTLAPSTKPYFVKIFDLFSKKLVNVYKIKKFGWQTLQITGWRDIGAKRIDYKRVGLKLVVQFGKKKLRIEQTPFRKTKSKREPYLVVYLHEKDTYTIDTTSGHGIPSLFNKPIFRRNIDKKFPFLRHDGRRLGQK